VVASPLARSGPRGGALSQSPSLRGSGRFGGGNPPAKGGRGVSIPFIAGQWSLPYGGRGRKPKHEKSQSPSLRGSGRFARGRAHDRSRASVLNPLHCGAVVASPAARRARAKEEKEVLNPLHCGAVVASQLLALLETQTKLGYSIPFIAGQWSLRKALCDAI